MRAGEEQGAVAAELSGHLDPGSLGSTADELVDTLVRMVANTRAAT
ncbi:hypothetical protein [Streptomyces sp. NPDC059271]